MEPDLTTHENAGVRWQAQMEEYLAVARERIHVAQNITSISDERSCAAFDAHVRLAQAASTAALALAVANAGSDIEMALSTIADSLHDS